MLSGRVLFFSSLDFKKLTHDPFVAQPTGMANCVDVLLVILLIFAICVDLCGIAAIIWYLVGVPSQWQNWILSFYALFFCFVQIFIEIVYPQSEKLLYVTELIAFPRPLFNKPFSFCRISCLFLISGSVLGTRTLVHAHRCNLGGHWEPILQRRRFTNALCRWNHDARRRTHLLVNLNLLLL